MPENTITIDCSPKKTFQVLTDNGELITVNGYVFHILFAIDVQGDNVRVVTAYHPNPKEWEKDLKRRRQSP